MPYSRSQLDKILNVGGRPFILPEQPVPYSMRVCESLVRRRLYALEDEAVAEQWRMYRTAYAAIRNRALDLADMYNVRGELATTSNVIRWRRQVDAFVQTVGAQLADQLAQHALRAAGNMYLMGYYGRAWALDMATVRDQVIRAPIPNNMAITRAVLHPDLSEAFEPDKLIYDALGVEWRQAFGDLTAEMVRKVRSTLNAAIQNHLNLQSTMQQIADVLAVSISRSEGFKANFNRIQALTRTYTMNAANEGALGLYRQNANLLSGTQFLAAHDGRVCPTCARLDGTVWALGSDELVRPPVHVNCILPGNIVELPGKLVAATQSFYVGRAIEFTLGDGRKFSVTENHPILTPKGWVRAQFVQTGDNVLGSTEGQRMAQAINPDNDKRPALIEEIFRSFKETGGMVSASVKAAAEDFYGDGQFINGNIDIVNPYSLLLSEGESGHVPTEPIIEQPSKLILNRISPSQRYFMGLRAFNQFSIADFNPFTRFMRPVEHSRLLFGRGVIPSLMHGIGDSAWGNASFKNPFAQNITVNAEFGSQGLFTFPGDVPFQDRWQFRDVNPTASKYIPMFEQFVDCFTIDPKLANEFVNRFAADVTLNNVVSVRNFDYSGHVYDLQVEPYQLYICNGVIVKNCRCTLIPVLSVASSDPTAPPSQTWLEWLTAAGLGWLLGSELTDVNTGDDIDSSQIGDDDMELGDVV